MIFRKVDTDPTVPMLHSGVATRGMGGSGPPTSVQTPLGISANSLNNFLHIGGTPTWFGPPTSSGLAKPLMLQRTYYYHYAMVASRGLVALSIEINILYMVYAHGKW